MEVSTESNAYMGQTGTHENHWKAEKRSPVALKITFWLESIYEKANNNQSFNQSLYVKEGNWSIPKFQKSVEILSMFGFRRRAKTLIKAVFKKKISILSYWEVW